MITKFQSGAKWTGNRRGRPVGTKTTDIRHVMSKELAVEIHGSLKEIVHILIGHAINHEEWAVKLFINAVLPFCLAKPKVEGDGDGEEIKHIELVDKLSALPNDKLLAIRNILIVKDVENGS